jgi:hypothetical protein
LDFSNREAASLRMRWPKQRLRTTVLRHSNIVVPSQKYKEPKFTLNSGEEVNPGHMNVYLLACLIGWVPVGAYLFRRYPARIAILANFLGGWAVLPGAVYAPTTAAFPYWIMGVCLPTNYLLTKATVTGLAGLVGVLLFHSSDLKRFRPGLCDLPMAVWCCVPLLTAATNWSTFPEGICGVAYQSIAWGVPWLLGRVYFSDNESLLLFARACVIGGVCYVPICIVEICAGPQLYAFVYGYQPYRWIGAGRYVGFRPIGMMEDGNQLGIWMAAATLIAFALLVHQPKSRLLGMPLGWVAAGLACTTLLCQSVGSISLLLLLLPFTMSRGPTILRRGVAVIVVAAAIFVLVRMTGLVPLRALAQQNGLLHSIVGVLGRFGRQSLAWRLSRDENFIRIALHTPFLGSGQWNWWQIGDSRPWSLWLLVFGMYGIIGLLAFESILLLPVIRVVWPSASSNTPGKLNLRPALSALILMVAIDSLFNGALILPYLLVMGALSSGEGFRTVTAEQFGIYRRRAEARDSYLKRPKYKKK